MRLSGDHTNTDRGHIFTIPKRLTFYGTIVRLSGDHTNTDRGHIFTIPKRLTFYGTIVRLSGDHTNTARGHIFTIPKRLTFYDELHNSDALATTVIEKALVSSPNLIIIIATINSKLLDQ